MFIEQPSIWLRWLYPFALWRMDRHEKAVYLTFDDGPVPEVTPWVLNVLDRYHIKATFFMVGNNVARNPDIFEMVKARGHRLGNHTYNHWGSLRHSLHSYSRNIERANNLIESNLFRPPYGWMAWSFYVWVRIHYKIVMWDLVTRDYSKKLNGKDVLRNVRRYARNGSIITFHDSHRAEDKLYYALPRAIEWLQAQGYAFKVFD